MSIEKASENQSEAGTGMGLSFGMLLPGPFGTVLQSSSPQASSHPCCPNCDNEIPSDARFCPLCGHQIIIFRKCPARGKNVPPKAQFFLQCGSTLEAKPQPRRCRSCDTSNLPEAVYCNQCGERP